MSSKRDLSKQSKRQKLLKEIKKQSMLLTNKQKDRYNWLQIGRKEQQMPDNFHVWIILAGRGFGKTRAGSEAIKQLVEKGYKNICIMGETMLETRKVMVEGRSGLLSVFKDKPKYSPSKRYIELKNGAKIHLFSAEQPEGLRGPQFDAAWIDEFAKFQRTDECWKQIMMSVRLGSPKIIITTTPKPISILHKLIDTKNVVVTRGSTLDNRVNLSEEFIECILAEYGDTKFGKQEIYGELLNDDLAVLWKVSNLKYGDFSYLENVVIGVDPAVTSNSDSDETGIIVAGKDVGGKYYIVKDCSGKLKASEWPQLVVSIYHKYNASKIVIEINQGGDLLTELLLQVDQSVIIEPVRAVKNKFIRAQAIANLYEMGKVLHCEKFPELEHQMLNFANLPSSPDRVDAMVWALHSLQQSRVTWVL